MLISRRKALASMISISAGLSTRLNAGASRCTIVTASKEGPHAAAIEGMQRAFGDRSIASVTFRLPGDESAFRQDQSNGANQLAIAVGIDAVRAVASSGRHAPLLATMTFRADLENLRSTDGAELKLAGALWLDLPVSQVVAGLRVIFPGTARLAVVRSPSRSDAGAPSGQVHQLPAGVSVKFVECASAAELLVSLRKLRGQVDFVICLPDSNLYNKTTVEPLILASLEHKLPLVGFSASFTRAGAAVGVYPDFAEVGRQTAAMSERLMSNPSGVHEEFPRRTTLAVNERVLRLLGREYRPKQGEDVLVIR
jgi:putative ABC transport system substrate-binding protein